MAAGLEVEEGTEGAVEGFFEGAFVAGDVGDLVEVEGGVGGGEVAGVAGVAGWFWSVAWPWTRRSMAAILSSLPPVKSLWRRWFRRGGCGACASR
ncbi:MAG: hypothetical protein U0232_24190 [Thermomicrobiales bacterium]